MATNIDIIKSMPAQDVKQILNLFKGVGHRCCDDYEIHKIMRKRYSVPEIHSITRTYLAGEFDFRKYFEEKGVN